MCDWLQVVWLNYAATIVYAFFPKFAITKQKKIETNLEQEKIYSQQQKKNNNIAMTYPVCNLPMELRVEIQKHIPTRDLPNAILSSLVPQLTDLAKRERYFEAIDTKFWGFMIKVREKDPMLWQTILWIVKILNSSSSSNNHSSCITWYVNDDRTNIRSIKDAKYVFVRLSPCSNNQESIGKRLKIPKLTGLTHSSFALLLFEGDKVTSKRIDSFYNGTNIEVTFFHRTLYGNEQEIVSKLKLDKVLEIEQDLYALIPIKQIKWMIHCHKLF